MCSCHDSDTLDTDKLIGNRILNFQTQFDGFLDPLHQDIERFGLRMAASQCEKYPHHPRIYQFRSVITSAIFRPLVRTVISRTRPRNLARLLE